MSDGNLSENDITEDVISDNLFSAGIPDPDLIIRPSGELRFLTSCSGKGVFGVLLTDRLWPDFGEKDINRALHDFENRKRRFGGV